MKLKNIALTMLTVASLTVGTANKSEANNVIEKNRILASVSISLIGFAYREDYISENNFNDGLQTIAYLHRQCKKNQITCEESSEILEELSKDIARNLRDEEIEEAKEIAVSQKFISLVNQLLGY